MGLSDCWARVCHEGDQLLWHFRSHLSEADILCHEATLWSACAGLYKDIAIPVRRKAILRSEFSRYVVSSSSLKIQCWLRVERFLGTAFSLDDNLSAIVNAIKTERDDIERLRGMIDGQREFVQDSNPGTKYILTDLFHRGERNGRWHCGFESR